MQCQKKSRDANQRKEVRPHTARTQIPPVNQSGLGHFQAKDKNPACRQ